MEGVTLASGNPVVLRTYKCVRQDIPFPKRKLFFAKVSAKYLGLNIHCGQAVIKFYI
jgi:hypothetical protein